MTGLPEALPDRSIASRQRSNRRNARLLLVLLTAAMTPASLGIAQTSSDRLKGFGPSGKQRRLPAFGPYGELVSEIIESDRIGARSAMSKLDVNKDENLSKAEMANAGWSSQVIKQMDRNGDGDVSFMEMCLRWAESRVQGQQSKKTARPKPKPKPPFVLPARPRSGPEQVRYSQAQVLASKLMSQYDRNRNKQLDSYEWDDLAGEYRDVRRADKSSDGVIKTEELVAWLFRRMAPATSSQLVRQLRLFDAAGDGQISMKEYASEWTDAKLAEFRSLDFNGDGIISAAESRSPPRPVGSLSFDSREWAFLNSGRQVVSTIYVREDIKIKDLDIRVAITKQNEDRMRIYLTGPDGSTHALFEGGWTPWAGGPVFDNILIDDEAPKIASTLSFPPFPRRLPTNAKPTSSSKRRTPPQIQTNAIYLSGLQPVRNNHNGFIIQLDGNGRTLVVPNKPTPTPPKPKAEKGTLGTYYGKSAKGEWKLSVTNLNNAPGVLREWAVVITPAN